jgi:ATP-dependent DNA helicase RecG
MIMGYEMGFAFADLQKWISEWESPGLEFKLSVQKDAGDTISAFANTYGGTLIFGVDSRTREPKGVNDPDKESLHLREILDNCKPKPVTEQHFIRHEGKTTIALTVEAFPYSQNPCFYGDFCFIRQGTSNVKMRGDELIRFLKRRNMHNFEEFKADGSMEDLDTGKINAVLEKRGINTSGFKEEDYRRTLIGLKVAGGNNPFFLKNVALFFFAKEPQRFFMNFVVRIVRYSGKEREIASLKFDRSIEGTLPELVDRSLNTVLEQVGSRFVIERIERKEIPEYPIESVRELITNAVGHRDYTDSNDILIEIFEDRLQVTNPGALLAGQTITDFDKTPQHRNQITYRLLREFGFGEGLGTGIRMIRTQFRQANLPDPEFYQIGIMFQAIVYNGTSTKKRYAVNSQNPRQRQALAFLERNKTMKASDYAQLVGVSEVTAVKDLNELVKQGKIRKIGKYRGARYELENPT